MPTNIVVIEDEYPAAERLSRMIESLPDAKIVAVLESVEIAVNFFRTNSVTDLIFSDIQLSDGLSFEIFEQTMPQSPIIFTTSYDEYAIKAFKVKSIDYLLKPVKMQELEQAYQKFLDFRKPFSQEAYHFQLESLFNQLHTNTKPKSYKQRFLVKYQEQIIPISQEQIAYFYASNKMVCMVLKENKQFIIDYTLEELEEMLNPDVFFRLNRQFIASAAAIHKIYTYFNGKLKIELTPTTPLEVLVSREKNTLFQAWLETGQ